MLFLENVRTCLECRYLDNTNVPTYLGVVIFFSCVTLFDNFGGHFRRIRFFDYFREISRICSFNFLYLNKRTFWRINFLWFFKYFLFKNRRAVVVVVVLHSTTPHQTNRPFHTKMSLFKFAPEKNAFIAIKNLNSCNQRSYDKGGGLDNHEKAG